MYTCLTSRKTTVYSGDVVKGPQEDSHYSQTVLRDLRFAFKQQIPPLAFNGSDASRAIAEPWHISTVNYLFNAGKFVSCVDGVRC